MSDPRSSTIQAGAVLLLVCAPCLGAAAAWHYLGLGAALLGLMAWALTLGVAMLWAAKEGRS